MADYTAQQVADWFLSKKGEMSPKKIQKLVYYAYSWYLTIKNEPTQEIRNRLFDEKIEAWVHGPVVPILYKKYKIHGYNDIPAPESEISFDFDEETEDILDQVYKIYGKYNGNELESITHQEEPWNAARVGYGPLDICNENIDDQIIIKYYSKRLVPSK